MIYQGGGEDGDRASIRLAESVDLHRWSRVSTVPLFTDFCVARDPMLVRRDPRWSLYHTRCASRGRRASGVAHRTSRDLVHWSEPTMALTLGEATVTPDSGYTESPFVFERGGAYYLSVTSYPIGRDATFVYRSRDPLSFPDAPLGRVRAHAADWLFDRRGRAHVTHAGPGNATCEFPASICPKTRRRRMRPRHLAESLSVSTRKRALHFAQVTMTSPLPG